MQVVRGVATIGRLRSLLVLGIGIAVVGASHRTGAVISAGVMIESGIRLEHALAPALHWHKSNQLRMYFVDGDGGIHWVKTRKGLKFGKRHSASISVGGGGAADPSVVDHDGKLRMYFKVLENNATSHRIWRATARNKGARKWDIDGLVFQRLGRPCDDWTSAPHAVVLPDERVRLYFVCGKDGSDIASAVSTDGVNFEYEKIVLRTGVDPYVVVLDDGTFRMFYHAPGAVSGSDVLTATSTDGLRWRNEQTLVSSQQLGAAAALDPAADLLDDGRWRIYIAVVPPSARTQEFDIISVIWTPDP